MSEHDEQVTVVQWAELQTGKYPDLELLFAIPNGGGRGKPFIDKGGNKRPPLLAIKLKREGLKSGVPDLMLPVAKQGFHGLFIEMKDKNSPSAKLSDKQLRYQQLLLERNYMVRTCWDAGEGIQCLINYLNLKERV